MDYENSNEFIVAIISWLQQIETVKDKVQNYSQLIDGTIFFNLLEQIQFTEVDRQLIINTHQDPSLIFKNLSYLLDILEKYYQNILNKDFNRNYVDIFEISNHSNKIELLKLVEFIIGALVQSNKKEDFIGAILSLESDYQGSLMLMIEKGLQQEKIVQNPESNTVPKHGSESHKLLDKVYELENEKDRINLKYELLEEENLKLKEKMQQMQKEFQSKDDEINQWKNKFYRKSTDILNENNDNEEKELLNQENVNLKKQIQLIKNGYELQILQKTDLIDDYKRRIQSMGKLELTIEFYKGKYEEYTKLNEQLQKFYQDKEIIRQQSEESEINLKNLQTKYNEQKLQWQEQKKKLLDQSLQVSYFEQQIEFMKQDLKEKIDKIVLLEQTIQGYQNQIDRNIANISVSEIHRVSESENNLKQDCQMIFDNDFIVFNNSEIGGGVSPLKRESRPNKANQSIIAQNEQQIEMLNDEIQILNKKVQELSQKNTQLQFQKHGNKEDQDQIFLYLQNENDQLNLEVKELRKKISEYKDETLSEKLEKSIIDYEKLKDGFLDLQEKYEDETQLLVSCMYEIKIKYDQVRSMIK